MASLDVIALDPTVPQLRAPAVGDTYHFCRVVEFQDGTDAAPSITNVGDTNTGIYWPNADELAVSTGGVQRLSLGATTVFNETGADVDFRIEGDTDANLVFVDASTDRVGLGLNNPDRLLDVDGSSKFRGQILITSGEALSLGLQALQLPTGVESTIGAGLSTRTGVAGESIIQFGNNMNTYYTGSVNAAKAGAMIRIDTRGVEPTPGASAYSVFQIQTRAAGVADPNYTVPVQIGAAPQGTFCIQTNGLATFNYGFVVNEGGGDYDTRFEGDTDTHLFFADASTDRIGIGTNAPGYKLDVNGTANFANNVTFTGGTANGVLYLNGSKVATSGSALTFDGSALGVSSASNNQLTLNAVSGSTGTRITFSRNSTANTYFGDAWSITGANLDATALFTTGTNPLIFGIGTEQMRLTSTGLGIGTSSPGAKLDIVTSSTTAGVRVNNATAGKSAMIIQNNGSNVGIIGLTGYWTGDSSTNFGLFAETGSNIQFSTNGVAAPKATIDTSGNLGLGVTPSAWSGAKGFESGLVGNYFIGSTAASYTSIGTAAYYNGTNWIYARSTGASKYELLNNTHAWFNAPSGTAGNNITFTQAMTLDASGNLGVGTTSPLSVTGSTYGWRVAQLYGSGDAAFVINGNNGAGRLHLVAGGASANQKSWGIQSFGGSLIFASINDALGETERARITSGGYFKASNDGTYQGSTSSYHESRQSANEITHYFTNKSATLTANNGIVIGFTAASPDDNTAKFFECNDSTTARCIIYSDGDLANHDGVYGTISDERLKQDIVDAPSQWDDLKAVRFRKYRMKTDVEADPNAPALLGVVAQELEQVCPGLVDEHPDMEMVEVTDEEGNVTQKQQPTGTTTKTVKSSILLMKAAVALQEAMARIEKLEAEMAALKGV